MQVQHLTFAYDQREILSDINLILPQGKFISILGPNGSGKSTLLKLLLGLLETGSGQILLADRPLTSYRPLERARQLAYVPQITPAHYEYTVGEVVLMGRYPAIKEHGIVTKQDQVLCDQAMALTHTAQLKDQPVNQISGGELQRVSVARAIAQDTPWILLDEPVNHLDISHQVSILKSLKAMTPQRSVIAVMHDLNLARDFSDHVILLHEGRVIKEGKPGSVINPEVLSSIYDLEFLRTWTDDRSLQYLFPRTR